jgi:hypothetical protein
MALPGIANESGQQVMTADWYLFDITWGFFVWIVDPLFTHAMMKGWIR